MLAERLGIPRQRNLGRRVAAAAVAAFWAPSSFAAQQLE